MELPLRIMDKSIGNFWGMGMIEDECMRLYWRECRNDMIDVEYGKDWWDGGEVGRGYKRMDDDERGVF